MSNGRSIARPIIAFLCVAVTVAGLINVYGDNAEVTAKAQTAACGKAECAVTMTRMSRNPIAQSFTFQTRLTERGKSGGQDIVEVDCQRAYFLVGEYRCERKGGAPR